MSQPLSKLSVWDKLLPVCVLTRVLLQGFLNFDGSRVSMHFSVPRDQRAFDQPKVLTDWICAKVNKRHKFIIESKYIYFDYV